nr:MAG: hypothetical protein [Wufeng shrew picorna-like virus 52]
MSDSPLINRGAGKRLVPPNVNDGQSASIPCTPDCVNIQTVLESWQPMGVRITVQTDYFPKPDEIIAAIPVNLAFGDIVSDTAKDWLLNPPMFRPMTPSQIKNPSNDVDRSVTFVQYREAPPITRLAKCFRNWSADISYRLQSVANMGTSGYLKLSVHSGTLPLTWQAYGDTNYRSVGPTPLGAKENMRPILPTFDPRGPEQIGYVRIDMSNQRHTEVTVPFVNSNVMRDRVQEYTNAGNSSSLVEADNAYAMTDMQQYVLISATSEIASSTQAPFQFEVEMRATKVKFANPIGWARRYITANYAQCMLWSDSPQPGTTPSGATYRLMDYTKDFPWIWPNPEADVDLRGDRNRFVIYPSTSTISARDALWYVNMLRSKNINRQNLSAQLLINISEFMDQMLFPNPWTRLTTLELLVGPKVTSTLVKKNMVEIVTQVLADEVDYSLSLEQPEEEEETASSSIFLKPNSIGLPFTASRVPARQPRDVSSVFRKNY